MPHATIILHQARQGAQGQATDIQIRAKEVIANKKMMIDILADKTGQPPEKIEKDTDRMFYMNPEQAKEYGLIDKVLENAKELPIPVPTAR